MYKEVGKKIMLISQVCGWLGFIFGLVAGIAVNDKYSWLFFVEGFCSLMFSWFGYGFGQLVQDVHNRNEKSEDNHRFPDDAF